MKEEQLIDALGKIDDAFIAESNPFAETVPSVVIQGEAKRETKKYVPDCSLCGFAVKQYCSIRGGRCERFVQNPA